VWLFDADEQTPHFQQLAPVPHEASKLYFLSFQPLAALQAQKIRFPRNSLKTKRKKFLTNGLSVLFWHRKELTMKLNTIRRRYSIHYAKLPGGYVEAAIWNRQADEPVWVETFRSFKDARETARAEMEAICQYLARRSA
jgi:hypothetical protein